MITLIVFLAIVALIGVIIWTTSSGPARVSHDTFMLEFSRENIAAANVSNDTVEFRLRRNADGTTPQEGRMQFYTMTRPQDQERITEFNIARMADYLEIRREDYNPARVLEATARNNEIAARAEGNSAQADIYFTQAEAHRLVAESHNAQAVAMLARVITFNYNNRHTVNFWSILMPIGSILLVVIIAIFLFRSISGQNKQAMNFGKSKTNQASQSKIRFHDVAGAEEEKQELQEIVEFLKQPQRFTKVGAKIPRGVLLVGHPGTGKTLFAKAVAGEAGVPFFSISGSDFVEMFVGVGASRVRDLFEQAKRNAPCIIFIDEIDAVGRQRGAGLGGGHDEREQTLNQLLVQMDGFETNEGVIVMAATNRADILDPALLRPGRFDRQIIVHLPDVRGREAIFKVHARNKPVAAEVDFQVLARRTSGFSGADIANLLNEAAILCARDNRTLINMKDIDEGITKVQLGPQKKSRLVTEVDKRIVAYHEAGHAIVAKVNKHCDPIQEVSIIPRGRAGGYVLMTRENDDTPYTINKLRDSLSMSMAGRAAEELVIEDVSAGAVGDFQQATNIARKMVMEWGMSEKLGKVFYGSDGEVFIGRDYQSQSNFSEETAAAIDKEVSKIIDTAYKKAIEILTKHRKEMDTLVRLLMECETVYAEEVEMIMNGKSCDEIKSALNERLKTKYANLSSAPPPESVTNPNNSETSQRETI